MEVEVKSSLGITLEAIETRLLSKRVIILDKNINAQVALEVIKQLLILSADKKAPIKLLIHSVGGEIDAGMMIIDAMRSLNVHTYCLGTAYSMAAIIFTAGQLGHRYMLPSAKLMLHEPRIMDNNGGTVTSIRELSKNLEVAKEKLIKVLADNTQLPIDICDKLVTDEDLFLDADKAIANKLCDGLASIGEML